MTFLNVFGCWWMNSCGCNMDELPPVKSVNGINWFWFFGINWFFRFDDEVELEVAAVSVAPVAPVGPSPSVGSATVTALENPP